MPYHPPMLQNTQEKREWGWWESSEFGRTGASDLSAHRALHSSHQRALAPVAAAVPPDASYSRTTAQAVGVGR
jgi:hypothetical protein